MALRSTLTSRASAIQRGVPRILQLTSINHGVACGGGGSGSLSIVDSNETPNSNNNIRANKTLLSTRNIHASSNPYNKNQFIPSPFARRSTIKISENFFVHRELKQGDMVHGIRRYLLIPRTDRNTYHDFELNPPAEENVIASLNANRNILFGAQLNVTNDEKENDDYVHQYLAACGSLLDIAKEDASINGQQVQALSTLNGLCSWVKECLDKDGEGSEILMGLTHGEGQRPTKLKTQKENKAPIGKRAGQTIKNASATLHLQKEADRINMLDAIRAIATGEPRPGHSVVGAGTYRDGEIGWIALAREYSQLATTDAVTLDASFVGRKGLEEMALYKSRDGEITKIEHLAHTQPEYLREAGGAMARLFFC